MAENLVKLARQAFKACRPVDRVACQDFGMQQDDILDQQLAAALAATRAYYAAIINTQAASLESAEKSYNVAVQRSLYWRNRAEQAEATISTLKMALHDANEGISSACNEVEAGIMREALEIIAGKRQCADNLMSNAEVAIAALTAVAQHGSDSREGK